MGYNTLKKSQLVRIWKQLDGACEALERLEDNEIETNIDFSAIVGLKNEVEEAIEKKSRK